jgi:hypothetical protein
VARLVGRLPGSLARALSFSAPLTLDGQTLDPHVQGIYTFRSCSPEAQAAARAWLRAVFGVHDDSGHVAALCARSRVFSDYPFAITMVNTRAYLPRTPQWRVFQNRNTPARSSRVFALFRFE